MGILDAYLVRVGGPGKINFLFLCHFISTWNARSYEFAVTVFFAAAFPDGLGLVSWCGIAISLAFIIFASSLGRWIDAAPSRLRTLLTSILINRIVIIISCVCWAILLVQEQSKPPMDGNEASTDVDLDMSNVSRAKFRLFLVILLLAIFERLSRIANLWSIERDWVPCLAIPPTDDKSCQAPQDLATLNSTMSRIDIICKLISPMVVAYLISSTKSPQFGPFSLIALNLLFWPLELWTARQVWSANRSLQEPKSTAPLVLRSDQVARNFTSQAMDWTLHAVTSLIEWFSNYADSLRQYFSTDIWMPSIAMTSLHFSVLSFTGILTVFLLQSGLSVNLIMWGETISAIFELSSTFVFARAVNFLSVRRTDEYVALQDGGDDSSADGDAASDDASDDDNLAPAVDQSIGASRLGMWALMQMLFVLIPTIPVLWQFSALGAQHPSTSSSSPSPTPDPSTLTPTTTFWQAHTLQIIILILFISFSRLGRWTNVLSVQQLAQTRIPPAQRSVFAGTEASLSSLFGLGHWVVTAVWSQHGDFRWVAVGSLGVVGFSVGVYGLWLLGWGLGRGRGRGIL